MIPLHRSALLFSLLATLSLPGTVLAEDAPKLDATPATQSAPAPAAASALAPASAPAPTTMESAPAPAGVDDLQAMREHMQELMPAAGIGPGNRCKLRPGMGLGVGPGMGMAAGMAVPLGQAGRKCDRRDGAAWLGMGYKCHHRHAATPCGCEQGRDLAGRLDELEKRMDMMQMMMQMMMR